MVVALLFRLYLYVFFSLDAHYLKNMNMENHNSPNNLHFVWILDTVEYVDEILKSVLR